MSKDANAKESRPAFPALRPQPLFRSLTKEEIAARDGKPMTASQRAACAFAATQIEASGKPKAEVIAVIKETIAKIEKSGAKKARKPAPKRKKASKPKVRAVVPKSKGKATP